MSQGEVAGLLFWVVVLVGVLVYLLPSCVAVLRGHKNAVPICVINVFLGWLLVGWVVALAWSFSHQDRPRTRRHSPADDNPFE